MCCYHSIIAYQYLKPNRAFGDFVLQPLKDDVEIGQRNAPSVMDLFRINRLYNCPATTGKYLVRSMETCLQSGHVIGMDD